VVGDGLATQYNNPELKVDINATHSVAEKELQKLRLITNELRRAYNGAEVEFLDTGWQ